MTTHAEILEMFDYKDGNLYWKKKASKKTVIGEMAGTQVDSRYGRLQVNKKLYLTHRLIFLWHHGYLPKFIDHIDGNSKNNRIENLRETTISLNLANTKKPKHNTSGYKNVIWHPTRNKWQVRIQINKKGKSFGYYKDLELANLVATEVRNKYFGEFANHGNSKD